MYLTNNLNNRIYRIEFTIYISLLFVLIFSTNKSRVLLAANSDHEKDYCYISAEYGSRFLYAMRKGNLSSMISVLKEAMDCDGFPDWLVEYNRNIMNSCEPNAIIFTGSNSDTNTCWYLQYVENYRRDVIVIPIGLLNRSWYVLTLKYKDHLVPNCPPMSLSREKIKKLDSCQWNNKEIIINISEKVQKKYCLDDNVRELKLIIDDRLIKNRKSYLSTNIAVMLDIIKTNAWQRPVYFSFECNKGWLECIQEYLQICGVSYKMIPVKEKEFIPRLDTDRTEEVLFKSENFYEIRNAASKKNTNIDSVLNNYIYVYLQLVRYYNKTGNTEKSKEVINRIKTNISNKIILTQELLEYVK